jgi:hypothetical protein
MRNDSSKREVARDGECCGRAQDQRGNRPGDAAREMGSRQVPDHEFSPCSPWKWRMVDVGSLRKAESSRPYFRRG